MDQFIFWVAAIVAVVAAFRVVILKNAIVSVLHLIVALVALAVLFLQLSAEFVAALQVIIYAGAIMVLFLFIVMMLNLRKDEFGPDRLPGVRILGALAAGAMLGELVVLFSGEQSATAISPEGFGSVRSIGRALFGEYIFPFELTSLLLVAAVLAAVVLARRRTETEPDGHTPLTPAGPAAGLSAERGEA